MANRHGKDVWVFVDQDRREMRGVDTPNGTQIAEDGQSNSCIDAGKAKRNQTSFQKERGMRVIMLLSASFAFSGISYGINCSSGNGRAGYSSGYNQESTYIGALWDIYGDCFDYDPFIENLDVTFSTSASSDFITCRNRGINDALTDKMVWINQTCGDECHDMGKQLGELNAKIFCGVAGQQYQAKAAYLPICSQFAAQACKQSFDGFVSQNCPELKLEEFEVYQRLKELACKFN